MTTTATPDEAAAEPARELPPAAQDAPPVEADADGWVIEHGDAR